MLCCVVVVVCVVCLLCCVFMCRCCVRLFIVARIVKVKFGVVVVVCGWGCGLGS